MHTDQTDVQRTIRAFLARANKPIDDLHASTRLYADGIGLDSLETAELSATLEDELGTDPFTCGPMPQTIGEIFAFYDSVAAGS